MQALAQEMKKRRVPADRLDDVVPAFVQSQGVGDVNRANVKSALASSLLAAFPLLTPHPSLSAPTPPPRAPLRSPQSPASVPTSPPRSPSPPTAFDLTRVSGVLTASGLARDTSSLGAPCSAKSGNQEIDAVSAATTSQISDDGFASDEDYTYDEGEEKEEEGDVHGVSAPSPARAPSPERARRTTSALSLAIAPGPPRAGSPPGAPSPAIISSPPRAASAPTASSPPPGSPGETTDAESETDEDPPQVDEVPPEDLVRVVGTERMADGEIRTWVEWEDTLEPFSALYPADARALARYLRRPQQMPVGPPAYHYEVIRGIHYPADGDLRVLMNWPNTLEPLSNLVPADREQVERANGIAGN
ncbi:hypothetical protein PHYSODRAFT_327998 [Phytophthora sojae]|uniref:Uncharacterized protein n=1 Tax=Phytophthora sojae (strain P6497) TaxID=1094619 RepID=G4ZAN1_PHYSP|nr:hypothetical protein PHYSODRAFT_327998 [Phytophthora sojae]EGZ19817.1 hypothetical protein PHYSODRAFT_327998 [Phytophthora sojae]|eukprot:XP_009522534.1 hypothetical protein PHYSODRAFT_327998 [Phytophthora sojae]